MAEGLGFAGSVVGVVSLTIQVIQVAVTFGKNWKDAPKDARDFVSKLEAFKTVLSETHTNIYANKDFAAAFEGKHSVLLSQLGPTAPKETAVKQMVKNCERELQKLLEELKKIAEGRKLGWHRLKGAFLASDTSEAVVKLHQTLQALNNMLSVDQISLQVTTFKEVREGRKERQEWHRSEERQKILAWLSKTTFSDQQMDTLSQRHPGTGEWLLKEDAFQKWRNGKPGVQSILWCPGIPGAGKSVMASIIIDHLQKFFEKKRVGVCFVYCFYQDRKKQTPLNLISSLVRQAMSQLKMIPEEAKTLFSEHDDGESSPSLGEYLKLFAQISKDFEKLFIVVDALDEHVKENKDSIVDIEFLDHLQQLQGNVGKSTVYRLCVTSREIKSIQNQLAKHCRIDIRAQDDDIRLFLQSRLGDKQFRFAADLKKKPDLTKKIIDKLVELAKGMFLLPHLHLSKLGNQTNIRELRRALDHLPTELDKTYDEAMTRIMGQMKGDSDLALRTLCWISNAVRPLRVVELQHALAVEPEDIDVDEESLSPESLITSVTAGLLTVDAQSGIIRLVHFTVEEYFKKKGDEWFGETIREIAETCLRTLLFDAFGTGLSPTDEDFEERLDSHAFYDYSARNWPNHIQKARVTTKAIEDLVLDLLGNDAKVTAASQAMLANRRLSGYSQKVPGRVTGAHLAVYFGLNSFWPSMLKSRLALDSPDSLGQTPLMWAAKMGQLEAVDFLLKQKEVDANARDTRGRTALLLVAGIGHEAAAAAAAAKKLLTHKANIKTSGNGGSTPLQRTDWGMHEEVAQLLLQANADILAQDSNGWTALHRAAETGNENMVRLLLDQGKRCTNSKNEHGHMWDSIDFQSLSRRLIEESVLEVLHQEVRGEDEKLVRLLIESGANMEMKRPDGFLQVTVLQCSVRSGKNPSMVRLLLEMGANVHATDIYGYTALHWAAKNAPACIPLLLQKGADVKARDGYGQTPLHRATYTDGDDSAVRLLLAVEHFDINEKDNHGQTSLSTAAAMGHEAIVRLLLDRKDIDVQMEDEAGRTALLCAANGWLLEESRYMDRDNGRARVVRALVEHGNIDVNAKDQKGNTALILATDGDATEVVEELLRHNVDVNLRNTAGRSPLAYAAERGNDTAVRLLLERGARVERDQELQKAASNGHETVLRRLLEHVDEQYRSDCWLATAQLCKAVEQGDAGKVKKLLESGADINAKSQYGTSLLHQAVSRGHVEVVRALLEEGADINAKSRDGTSLLKEAASRGHVEVARALLEEGANANTAELQLWSLCKRLGRDYEAFLRLLIEKGLDIVRYGADALSSAALNGDTGAAQLLLEKGVNSNSASVAGDPPLHWAARGGSVEVAKLLLDHGADVRKRRSGAEPVQFAGQNADLVRLLVENGADVDSKDDEGECVLERAARHGYVATVRTLLELGADPSNVDVEGIILLDGGQRSSDESRPRSEKVEALRLIREALEG